MNLEFATSSKVIFGQGEFDRLGERAAALGDRALVVLGRSAMRQSGAAERLAEQLARHRVEQSIIEVASEPTVGMIDAAAAEAASFGPKVIIALGGGSVIDAGKAFGALLANGGGVADYLEGVGEGRKIEKRSVPVIAVPTTAGTGSEVTKNAVIRADDGSFKRSMRSPSMRPEIALVDPTLTASCPPAVTAAAGLDAQCQLIEAFTSRRAGILTDGLVREGLNLVANGLEKAYTQPGNLAARESMAMASLLSGMALDNAGLGAVHGLASAIGAAFEVPHGVICGAFLPEITEMNIELLRKDEEGAKVIGKYEEISRILTGSTAGDLDRLISVLGYQRHMLKLPTLDSFGIRREHIPAIIAASRTGNMETNPAYLGDPALWRVLEKVITK